MKKIVLNSKPTSLFRYYHGELFVRLDIQEEFKDETKFKNSAFVKTGRKVPTGNYTAFELLINRGSYLNINWTKMRQMVNNAIDNEVKYKIRTGLVWKGCKVWLSDENQRNYASWVTAAKSNKSVLPLRAKFNDPKTNELIYYDFANLEELEEFYGTCVKHINTEVNRGRDLKDDFEKNALLYKESFEITCKS